MFNRYRPTEIRAFGTPVTARNSRNSNYRPVYYLGNSTPSQVFSHIRLGESYTACVIGNPARAMGIARAMIRQTTKPFLFIGTKKDENSQFSVLQPDWTLNALQPQFPDGNGAVYLSRPTSSYLELCEYFEEWCQDYFIIFHLGGGFRIGHELLNLLGAAEQCLIYCDSVPSSLRSGEARTLTAKEFLSQMSHLFVFSAGIETKDLIEILPTYQYERVTNTLNINAFNSRPLFRILGSHTGNGVSWGQARTMEYKKSLFEMDELKNIFDDGTTLLYDTKNNSVFLACII